MISEKNWNNGFPPSWTSNDLGSKTFYFQPLKDCETNLLDECDNQDNDNPGGYQTARNIVNVGNDQQMEIFGYKHDLKKSILVWMLTILSAGLLRLIFHWKPEWMLFCTATPCHLQEADQILLLERYKKFKTYIVRVVKIMKWNRTSVIEDIPVSKAPTRNQEESKSAANINNTSIDDQESLFFYPGVEYSTSGGYWYTKYFTCKKMTYIWNEDVQNFNAVESHRDLDARKIHRNKGLSEAGQFVRRMVYGPNIIHIKVKSIFNLLFLEVLNPFYVFQVFSVCLWFAQDYYYYAAVIILMSVASITTTVFRTRKNQNMLKQTVTSSDFIEVMRDNDVFQVVSSDNIVPGDIITIPPHGCVMHCDAVLMQGNCIVNESMLTGESVPVTKIPFPQQPPHTLYSDKDHARYTLFCGTKVIQTRYVKSEKVKALVLRTGYSTMKGELVRSIMYPKPVDFKFTTDSYKFIGILALIALTGFVYNIIIKILRKADISTMIMDSLDLITITVPPALPAAMTVGILFASVRLKNALIYCISPNRINLAGLINCVCFDKTGTLTEDGLDMLGTVPVVEKKFQMMMKTCEALKNDNFVIGMATCHSLTLIENELVGDPLDLKMFEATGWLLEEPDVDDTNKYNMLFPTVVTSPHTPENLSTAEGSGDPMMPELQTSFQVGIVRQFPFSSSLQRMGVITRTLGASHFDFFCKGSPEMIKSLSLSNTIPEDFEQVLREYTQHGYRVIALAHKFLKLKYTRISKVSREELEEELTFLGLLVLENRLKPTTKSVIAELNHAKIRVIMVTGDNMLTALSVARECEMVGINDEVVVVSVKRNENLDVYIDWNRLEHEKQDLYGNVVQIEKPGLHFAISGPDFQLFMSYFPHLLSLLLTKGAVFARMGPSQKQVLVEELQALGYYIAMCGDGANDCGALKAAHTGISLSEAEASVASPFTSRENDIRCVPQVIREGRAALVTSFGMFKYMATYSIIQFVSVIILYTIDSSLTDLQFLYIDLCLISVFAALFGYTHAYQGPLVAQKPPGRLVSLGPLLSLILQIVVIVIFQVVAFLWLRTKSWFVPYNHDEDLDDDYVSYENYTLFVISIFQYIGTVIIFSKAGPYRKPLYTNYLLLISILLMLAFSVYLGVLPSDWLIHQFSFRLPPDITFRWSLIGLAVLNFMMSATMEYVIVDYLVTKVIKPKYLNYRQPRKKFLQIEKELSKISTWPPDSVTMDNLMQVCREDDTISSGRDNLYSSEKAIVTLDPASLPYQAKDVYNAVEMSNTNNFNDMPLIKNHIEKSPL